MYGWNKSSLLKMVKAGTEDGPGYIIREYLDMAQNYL
jgi:hypothetical protein